jgi:hypothetical protein
MLSMSKSINNYYPVSNAFSKAKSGLKNSMKFEIYQDFNTNSKKQLDLEKYIRSDRFLIDLGEVNVDSINLKTVMNDCDFLKKALSANGKSIIQIIKDMKNGNLKEAIQLVNQIGVTEDDSIRAGGGLLGLIVLAVALLGSSGCAHVLTVGKGRVKVAPSSQNGENGNGDGNGDE